MADEKMQIKCDLCGHTFMLPKLEDGLDYKNKPCMVCGEGELISDHDAATIMALGVFKALSDTLIEIHPEMAGETKMMKVSKKGEDINITFPEVEHG